MSESPSPARPARFRFASKAMTLERLGPHLTGARLCDQIIVGATEWRARREDLVGAIVARFAPARLAIRSSAASEDGWNDSQAGVHLSRTDVEPTAEAVGAAIDEVLDSYVRPVADDQILVQPMVEGVVISGVLLTRDLNTGSPYYVINYDDFSGRTDTVTGGGVSKTILVHRTRPDALKSPRFRKLVDTVAEIERITGSNELDIEFCITDEDEIYVLQVRPLAARQRWKALPDETIDAALDGVRNAVAARMGPQPPLAGSTTIFGEMPDWNPAEMIGNAPRPLALSLYRRLITDHVWAEARAAMGYRRVAGPLLVDFCGRPYVDVRLSFNSFLPADLGDDLAHRLVDYQLQCLSRNPDLHDKIEFEIALPCRDFAFAAGKERLRAAGFRGRDVDALDASLARLTAAALAAGDGELDRLLGLSNRLLEERPGVSGLPPLDRVRRLCDDCRRLGTLPFAQLARHGFIGVSFLHALVKRGVFTGEDRDAFMRGIRTVATDLILDMQAGRAGTLDRDEILRRYGHLRPGTYDILSWRYDERPDLFLGHAAPAIPAQREPFEMSPGQRRGIADLLAESGYDRTPEDLLAYIAAAIKAREQAKLAFTRSVSDILSTLAAWGEGLGLSRSDLSFLSLDVLLADGDPESLKRRAADARAAYDVTRAIRLPHLIREPADIDVVRLPLGRPTFITGRTVTGPTAFLGAEAPPDIDGRIVLTESADPGFDWIFSHRITGLITKYGGANSHMAIRCAEFGLPAAIGCGERLFASLSGAAVIALDCAAHKVSGH